MYTAKDFSHLLGLTGFSDTMLTNHFTLYQGYVTNANKMFAQLDKDNEDMVYGELKRRLGWEINGVKMHELYFENMTKESSAPSESVKGLIEKNFGSMENWDKATRRNGMTRGIGWVVLLQDNDTGEIFNSWVGEHNVGNILNAKILLVMDCWEHAYMTDYGIKKADYISAFINAVDWGVVEKRLGM